MALSDITATANDQAIAEFDRLGQDEFLSKRGFDDGREFFPILGSHQLLIARFSHALHAALRRARRRECSVVSNSAATRRPTTLS
jgi:hypothetical protein